MGTIIEPSAGNGAIIRACEPVIPASRWFAYEIREEESDGLNRMCNHVSGNFLKHEALDLEPRDVTAVVGNPPYSLAWEFVQRSIALYPNAEVCFLLRLAFAASEERNEFMRRRPPDVYVLPNRPSFTGEGSDSADYAWFVWPAVSRAARFQVLKTTPLAERQRDNGHAVMIPDPQLELVG